LDGFFKYGANFSRKNKLKSSIIGRGLLIGGKENLTLFLMAMRYCSFNRRAIYAK